MKEGFQEAFDGLQAIFKAYETRLGVHTDTPGAYYLNLPGTLQKGKPVWVGGVEIKKGYVSVHMMPFYMYPDLLDGISPALKKRMQGKACFNFQRAEPELFQELAQLTEAGFHRFREKGMPTATAR